MTALGKVSGIKSARMHTIDEGQNGLFAGRRGRVMLVDDSGVLRGVVSQWIEGEADLEVVARHANGQRAVQDVAASTPDVILLDIDMPVMDGLEALPLLKRAYPRAKVLMVSTLTKRSAEISLKALELGAADCLPKPETNDAVVSLPGFRSELLRKVRGLVRSSMEVSGRQKDRALSGTFSTRAFSPHPPKLIVIGSSTGGPEALCKLLGGLASALETTPVLIAQHMPPVFTSALADRLAQVSGLDVVEARAGQKIVSGRVYVAPGEAHMRLETGAPPRIVISRETVVNFCRPSVDILFESAARVFADRTLAIVLTGMGTDGTSGAKCIAEVGGSVIAQDFRSSVVWGMPGSATKAGACAAVLPLDKVAPLVKGLIAGPQGRGA